MTPFEEALAWISPATKPDSARAQFFEAYFKAGYEAGLKAGRDATLTSLKDAITEMLKREQD